MGRELWLHSANGQHERNSTLGLGSGGGIGGLRPRSTSGLRGGSASARKIGSRNTQNNLFGTSNRLGKTSITGHDEQNSKIKMKTKQSIFDTNQNILAAKPTISSPLQTLQDENDSLKTLPTQQ